MKLVILFAFLLSPHAFARTERLLSPREKTADQLRNYGQMLADYKRYCRQYPTTEQGLDALTYKSHTGPDCPDYPESGFIVGRRIIPDPWGHPFLYESDGKAFKITSLGRDGQPGGEGEDQDLEHHRDR